LTFRALTLAVLKAQVVEIRPLLAFEDFRGRCETFVGSFFDPIDALESDLGIAIPRPPPLAATLPLATAELLYSTVCQTIAGENEKEKTRVNLIAAQRQKTLDDVNALSGRELLDLSIEEKVASMTQKNRFATSSPGTKKPKVTGVAFSRALDELNATGVITDASLLAPPGLSKGKGKSKAELLPPDGKGKGKAREDPRGKGKGKGKAKGKEKGKEEPLGKGKGKGKGKSKGNDKGKGKGKSSSGKGLGKSKN
jgi:hypothetical protein